MSNICLSNSSSLKRKRSIRRIYYYLTYFTWSENSHDNSSKLYRLGPTWDVNYICCKFNTSNSMETLASGKNSTNQPRCKFFIAKESSNFCYWFFTPICLSFIRAVLIFKCIPIIHQMYLHLASWTTKAIYIYSWL